MGFIGNFFGSVLSVLGSAFAFTGSQACSWVWMDEPEMPKSMLK